MKSSVMEELARNWHESLLSNKHAREKFSVLKKITDFTKIVPLRPGLVTVPLMSELPQETARRLKASGLLDAKLNGMVSLPLYRATGQLCNFLFLSINGKDDRVLGEGGVVNIPAMRAFPRLVVVATLEECFAYLQKVKGNVVPLCSTHMLKDFKEAVARCNVQELVFMGSSPLWVHAREALCEIDVKMYEVYLPGKEEVAGYLEKNSANKLLAYIEADKALQVKNREKDTSNHCPDTGPESEAAKDAFTVEEEPGELRFTREERSYRVRGFNKDGFEKSVQLVLEVDGRLFPDKIDLARSQARGRFASVAGAEFELSPQQVRDDLAYLYQYLDEQQDERFKEKSGLHREELHVITPAERKKILDYLENRDIVNETLVRDTERLGHVGEDVNKKLYYLAAVSRLTGKPLSVLVIASSGTGKSFSLDTVLNLVRPEGLLKYSRITANALYYKSEEDLRGKILYLEELVGMEQAFESIRMLLSSGYLAVSVPEKDQRTGVMRTVERRLEVSIPILSSGTRDYFDDETMSRFLVTYNDESLEHRKRILRAQAHCYSLEGGKAALHKEKILKRYRDIDAVYDPGIKVVNPFASRIMVNPDLHIVTRKQDQYLRLMYNLAFARQHQKKKHEAEDRYGNSFTYVEVDRHDVATANEIAGQVFRFSRGDLTKRLAESFAMIEAYCGEQVKEKRISLYEYRFSRREIRSYTGWDITRTRRVFTELEQLEYLRRVSGSRSGMRYLYSLLPCNDLSTKSDNLQLLDPDRLG